MSTGTEVKSRFKDDPDVSSRAASVERLEYILRERLSRPLATT